MGLYKSELIHRQPWRDREHVEIETLDWVHWFNTEHPHESIDDLTPSQVEQIHYTHRTRVSPRQVDTKPCLRNLRGGSLLRGVHRTGQASTQPVGASP